MEKINNAAGIPISPLLANMENSLSADNTMQLVKQRLLKICVLSVIVSVAISLIAKVLITLINIVTGVAFFGKFMTDYHSPAENHLGWWVVIIPAIGGLLVGFMALYGSKAIRGHGIPEAMEQILTNQSKIKPSITFLKPLSSAIAIGTGGPFGAEGPIIATGGALGSTLGQLMNITSNERKIILAAGATAGMSAIFGTPIAAVFLAIELLLFEFSPRSILPVALACITGAAGHHILFEAGPVFPMPNIELPSNGALAIYSGIGLIIGFISMGVTKIVYLIEDAFDHLPIKWQWWPAMGGLAVGLIGYFAPHTLGVGYDNIVNVLSGATAILIVLRLCLFKFLSWAIALGSGTSGGTLAPLLTIGGAAGALLGYVVLMLFPDSGINLPLAALIGMSAMFAGASRAYLTSIAFALESTGQFNALLPLLGGCTAAYIVSFFLMENTIMTEKIARRGVVTPDSYEPDLLVKISVGQVNNTAINILNPENKIANIRDMIRSGQIGAEEYFVVSDDNGNYVGIVGLHDINDHQNEPESILEDIIQHVNLYVRANDSLRKAVEIMSAENLKAIPVLADERIVGLLSESDIIQAYKDERKENEQSTVHISLKRQKLKVMSRGKNMFKPQS
ncbi:chloride channel protein [Mucilaginibacter calamicampi]|uniref:Chloride channel protein n=1 Tax=Mucilaginibacter calamicampi TaxID=1302352 RepID=A0ABW2YTJ6_9SPHI